MRTAAALLVLSLGACYREARVVKREHVDDGTDKVSYVVREEQPGKRIVVHRDAAGSAATRTIVTAQGDRVLVRTDPISGRTTIVEPVARAGEVVAVQPEQRDEAVLVAPQRAREAAPRSESLAMWSRQNPEAAEGMCVWAERYPEAAGKYFEWEALHPDRAREVMAWAIEHRDAGVGQLADTHPASAEVFWQDRAAGSAYLDWVRRYPRAAESLLDHPRALAAAGARQACQ